MLAVDQHLGRPWAGVVVGGHGGTIGAGRQNGQHRIRGQGQRALPGQPIATLAHRTHHVGGHHGRIPGVHYLDAVVGLVQRRSHQVVHGGIHHRKMLALVVLQVFQAGQQQPGVAHQCAAKLEGHARQSLGAPLRQAVEQRLHQRFGGGGRFIVVADAQSAAQVQMSDGDALGLQLVHQGQHTVQRRQEWRALGDLRADVAVDAVDLQVGQGSRLPIRRQRLTVGDAELVFLQPGGNVGVRGCVHVRVDAQRHGGTLAHLAGNLVDALQLGQ